MPATPVCSYASVDRVYTHVPELGSITNLTSAHIAMFIGDSEAEVNASIAQKYALPISGDIPILTTIATELACYKVLAQRIFTPERLAASPWPDRYKEASLKLEALAAGELLLVTTSGDVVSGRTDIAEVWSNNKGYLPTMTEAPTQYQGQDSDKIDDILDARDFSGIKDRLL